MSWLEDLLGNLIQIEGVATARRRVWNWLNGPTLTDDPANARLNIDWGTIRGALASTLFRGTVNPIGANGAVLKSDGATAGGVWGLPTNLTIAGVATANLKGAATLYLFSGTTTNATPTVLTRVDDGSSGIQLGTAGNASAATFSSFGATARRTDAAGESGAYLHTGVCLHINGAGNLVQLGAASLGFTVIGESNAAWALDFSPNDSAKTMQVVATGEVGKTVLWVVPVWGVKAVA